MVWLAARKKNNPEMNRLWWVDPGWTSGAHQSCSTTPLPSAGQGRENIMKGWRVDIRTGRDHSPVTVMGNTDST